MKYLIILFPLCALHYKAINKKEALIKNLFFTKQIYTSLFFAIKVHYFKFLHAQYKNPLLKRNLDHDLNEPRHFPVQLL